MDNEPVKTIFLVGSIGAGKSTALEFFQSKGAHTLSADSVVHHLYETDMELIDSIAELLGSDVVHNGAIDRATLGAKLLMHPEQVQKLELLVHPVVRQYVQRVIETSNAKVFVYELPISRPSTDYSLADAVILLNASTSARLQRIQDRGFSLAEAQARLDLHPAPFVPSHLPLYEVQNDGTKAELDSQLASIWELIAHD
jgi:dephospho-CoA kinase